jgi:hypothetical protein
VNEFLRSIRAEIPEYLPAGTVLVFAQIVGAGLNDFAETLRSGMIHNWIPFFNHIEIIS